MKRLSDDEVKKFTTTQLIRRMDEIISSSFMGFDFKIIQMSVLSIMSTIKVKNLDEKFQRKIAYKVFGLILQTIHTHLSVKPNFDHFPKGDKNINAQFSWAESKQWMSISSRIIAEYFFRYHLYDRHRRGIKR